MDCFEKARFESAQKAYLEPQDEDEPDEERQYILEDLAYEEMAENRILGRSNADYV